MNKRIKLLAEQAGFSVRQNDSEVYTSKLEHLPITEDIEKFAQLIVRECNAAVLSVPCYYKDYRSQIEEAVINDCGRAVLEHFGVEE